MCFIIVVRQLIFKIYYVKLHGERVRIRGYFYDIMWSMCSEQKDAKPFKLCGNF